MKVGGAQRIIFSVHFITSGNSIILHVHILHILHILHIVQAKHQVIPLHPSPNVSSQSRILAPKWGTHHFWEIHICGAAPLSINAILAICEGLVAARMTLCVVVNTSHPHIPETHQESHMKAFVG